MTKISIPFKSYDDAKNHSMEIGNFVTDDADNNYFIVEIEDEIVEINDTYNVIIHIEEGVTH